ncbi:MAG: hypothetical protein V1888_01615 [archaeon]
MKQDKILIKELEKLKLPESGLKKIIEESTGLIATILGFSKVTMYTTKNLQKEKTYGYVAYGEIISALEYYSKNIQMAITLQ